MRCSKSAEAEFMNIQFLEVSGHNIEELADSEVSVYNVNITNPLQNIFAQGVGVGGGE